MMRDYFSDNPVFGPHLFRHRYRMIRELFLSILKKVCLHDSYFVQKFDACGLCGLSLHQKITSALHMLCYGMYADATNEYCRTTKSIALESLRRFCLAIRAIYEPYHLRQPTRANFDKHLAKLRGEDFQGCLVHWTACIGSGRTAPLHGKGTLETGREKIHNLGGCCNGRLTHLAWFFWIAWLQ